MFSIRAFRCTGRALRRVYSIGPALLFERAEDEVRDRIQAALQKVYALAETNGITTEGAARKLALERIDPQSRVD